MATTTHACPGGCGAQVARHLYACRICWLALPAPMRRDISQAYARRDYPAHRAAMLAGARWYANRRPAPLPIPTEGGGDGVRG